MIGGMSFVTKITVVLCSGGYTGLILGFFGGILYLYRSEPRHLAAATPSQVFPQQLCFRTDSAEPGHDFCYAQMYPPVTPTMLLIPPEKLAKIGRPMAPNRT